MAGSREEQRHGTATRVLTAARELFRSRGFARTTVRDIAAACGVSTGTVMSVGDKNALLVASFDGLIAELHEDRASDALLPAGGDVEDRIVALFEPFLELFAADPALVRSYGAILVSGDHRSVVFTELSGVLVREIAAQLREATHGAVQNGDAPDFRTIAESIYFAYIGRLFTWSPEHDADLEELRRSMRGIVAAICRGGGNPR